MESKAVYLCVVLNAMLLPIYFCSLQVIDCEEKIEKTSQELVDSKQNNAALKEEVNHFL